MDPLRISEVSIHPFQNEFFSYLNIEHATKLDNIEKLLILVGHVNIPFFNCHKIVANCAVKYKINVKNSNTEAVRPFSMSSTYFPSASNSFQGHAEINGLDHRRLLFYQSIQLFCARMVKLTEYALFTRLLFKYIFGPLELEVSIL